MPNRISKEALEQLIIDYAYAYEIDPAIAVQQLRRESANYRDDVVYGPFVGGSGERGLTQFIPATWARFSQRPHTDAYEPDYALTAWGDYMSYLNGLFNGDYYKILASYNGGEGRFIGKNAKGFPVAAADRYAREIMAKAGVNPVVSAPAPAPADDQEDDSILGDGSYVIIAGVILALVLFLRK